MATTTNFGWSTPDDSDLVKDGALAIRTLGSAIDTSLVDLKGGTTGQVLSKNSNTDMDFTWVTSDDADAIQNSIVDAKGDLISATADNTPARLAVGNNGETLVADSSASQGLRWQGNFAAGKNKVINGDFNIWQRGTSFTAGGYTSDRWNVTWDGGGTHSITRETFTPGTAPVAGYEGQYYLRWANTVASVGGTVAVLINRIEDARTFAGQTVTVSFWAKTDSARTSYAAPGLTQNFGTGGSPSSVVQFNAASPFSFTTDWQRYSFTINVPSVSGKTFGTNNNSYFQLSLRLFLNTTFTFDIWGVQIEAGNVATAFQTATGTPSGERSACERYYYRTDLSDNTYTGYGVGMSISATNARVYVKFPTTMRVKPTSIDAANLAISDFVNYTNAATVTVDNINSSGGIVNAASTGMTQYRPAFLVNNNNTTGYLGFSAEF